MRETSNRYAQPDHIIRSLLSSAHFSVSKPSGTSAPLLRNRHTSVRGVPTFSFEGRVQENGKMKQSFYMNFIHSATFMPEIYFTKKIASINQPYSAHNGEVHIKYEEDASKLDTT